MINPKKSKLHSSPWRLSSGIAAAKDKEVQTLLLLSHVEELLGSAVAALEAAQRALTLSKRGGGQLLGAPAGWCLFDGLVMVMSSLYDGE